jgi:hypothetical protein
MKLKSLQHEKYFLKRLVHWQYDLEVAGLAAQQILTRHLHQSQDADDQALLVCLNICLTVSYWRPFTQSKGAEGVPRSLPDGFLDRYTDSERELHCSVKRSRNTAHAHSDPESMQVDFMVVDGPFAVPRWSNPFQPLTRSEVERLNSMISKILASIRDEQVRIQVLLDPGDLF